MTWLFDKMMLSRIICLIHAQAAALQQAEVAPLPLFMEIWQLQQWLLSSQTSDARLRCRCAGWHCACERTQSYSRCTFMHPGMYSTQLFAARRAPVASTAMVPCQRQRLSYG